MAAEIKKTIAYSGLRRFLCGVLLISVVVTIVASLKAGVSAPEIILRSLIVVVALSFLGRVIIKIWMAWEEVHNTSSMTSARIKRTAEK